MNKKLRLAVALCGVLSASSWIPAAQPVYVEFFDADGNLLIGPVTLIGLKGLVPGHEFVHTWTVDLESRDPAPVSQGVTVCFNVERPSVPLIQSLIGSATLQKVVFHFVRVGRTGPAEFFRITLQGVDVVSSRIELPPTYEDLSRTRDLEHIVGLRFTKETLAAFAVDPVEQIHYIRGDLNGDVEVDLSDAIKLFGYLFLGDRLLCPLAGDANSDGELDISDGAFVLNFLFLGGRPPPGPFPRCGEAGPDEAIPCDAPTCP